jgi:hypothetical protein
MTATEHRPDIREVGSNKQSNGENNSFVDEIPEPSQRRVNLVPSSEKGKPGSRRCATKASGKAAQAGA